MFRVSRQPEHHYRQGWRGSAPSGSDPGPQWFDQHTVANQHVCGTASQFQRHAYVPVVEILSRHEREISVDSFRSILQETRDHLDAGTSYIEMAFPFFWKRQLRTRQEPDGLPGHLHRGGLR